MADTMQFDLVSPERKLASLAANSVQIPAMDGDMTAMPNHAPFLTTLRPGIVRVVAGSEVAEFVVTGGFAEVSPAGATILAEQAVPRADVSGDLLADLLAGATEPSGLVRRIHSPRRFDVAVNRAVAHPLGLVVADEPALRERGERLKRELLDNPALGAWVNQLWSELLAWLQADMGRADSSIRRHIAQATRTLGERLAGDAAVRAWINDELQAGAPRLIERYREDIRRYIAARVQAWDATEMTAELERHIGRDLQFIRINGTLVGGLVGLAIHAATHLWR